MTVARLRLVGPIEEIPRWVPVSFRPMTYIRPESLANLPGLPTGKIWFRVSDFILGSIRLSDLGSASGSRRCHQFGTYLGCRL